MQSINPGMARYFKLAGYLAIAVVIADLWLSAKFGASIAPEMTIVMGAISLASGILLVIAAYFWLTGAKFLGKALACVWVPVFLFNVWSNMGVSTGNRMADVQQANIKTVAFNANKGKLDDARASLKLFEKRLADLTAAHGWMATVTADGLRAQLPAMDEAIRQESRRGGCGPKCLALQERKASVEGQIAKVEAKADLTKQIEATKRQIAKYSDEVRDTPKGISSAANQASLYAKLISFSLGDDPDQKSVNVANEVTGIATAFVLAFLAVGLTFGSAWPHLLEAQGWRPVRRQGDEPEADPLPKPGTFGRTHERIVEKPVIYTDRRALQALVDATARLRQANTQLAAA